MAAAVPAAPDGGRRRRRTREDVTERIADAARQLFADRGYHGTTTREIARLADVSETLLFRYYGSKATLFEEVVVQPFSSLMRDFVDQRRTNAHLKSEREILIAVYELVEKNQALFMALLSSSSAQREDGEAPSFAGLKSFFESGTAAQKRKYADSGKTPSFDLELAFRLTFGMLASSILLRDWLFPEGSPSREQIIDMLCHLAGRALGPGALSG